MLPSWMRSRNCRPRLVYFLAMEMTRRRLASTISFLAWRASRSPFCTALTMRRNSRISRPVSEASVWISPRSRSMRMLLVLDEGRPLAAESAHALEPRLVELVAEVLVDERLARHAVGFGQAHQLAFLADELLVDAVELLDEALDTVVVERQALHVDDDLVAQLVVGLLLLLGALSRRRPAARASCPAACAASCRCRRCGRRFREPSASARLPWRPATARSRSRPHRRARLRAAVSPPSSAACSAGVAVVQRRAAAAWPPGPRRSPRDR